MVEDAERFRSRARECRDVAAQARDPDWRSKLLEIAEELELEAARIEADEESPPRIPSPPPDKSPL